MSLKESIGRLYAAQVLKTRPDDAFSLIERLRMEMPGQRIYRTWLRTVTMPPRSSLTPNHPTISNNIITGTTQISTHFSAMSSEYKSLLSNLQRSGNQRIENAFDTVKFESPSDICILGNLAVSTSEFDLASACYEHAIFRYTDTNSLFSIAQFIQHAPVHDESLSSLNLSNGTDIHTQCILASACLYHAAASHPVKPHPLAMFNLSLLLQSLSSTNLPSHSGKNDGMMQESIYWLRTAASDHKLSLAFTPLAQLLLSNCSNDMALHEEALVLLKQAACLGDASAKLILGSLLVSKGKLDQAVSIWTEASSSELNTETWPSNASSVSKCLLRLGNLNFLGKHPLDVAPLPSGYWDSNEILDSLLNSSSTNSGSYEHSFFRSIPPNYDLASEYWQLAVDVDSRNAVAWLQLGNLYFDGTLVSKNYERAVSYYEQGLTSLPPSSSSPFSSTPSVSSETPMKPKLRPLLEGLILICYDKLGITPPEDLISTFYPNIVTKKRKKPLIRLFSAKEESEDFEATFMDGWKQHDKQSKVLHDSIAHRWSFVEDIGYTKS